MKETKHFTWKNFKTRGLKVSDGFVVRWYLFFFPPPFLIFSLQVETAATDPDSSSFRLDTSSGTHSKSSN